MRLPLQLERGSYLVALYRTSTLSSNSSGICANISLGNPQLLEAAFSRYEILPS